MHFLIQEGKRNIVEKYKCSLLNNFITMNTAEVEICRNNTHRAPLFPVLISYPLFRMGILAGKSIYINLSIFLSDK